MEINNTKLSLKDKINKLVVFLIENREKDENKITHVSISNNDISGSFNLENKFNDFKNLYIDIIKDNDYNTIEPLNILEVPSKKNDLYFEKIKFDFDFKIKDIHYNDIKKILKCDRLYNNETIDKITLLMSNVIYKILNICKYDINKYDFIIFEKDNIRYNSETKEYKDGFHIIINNLYIDYNTRNNIFNIIKNELSESDIFFYLQDEYLDIDKIFDNVIKKNWFLYGSSKPNEKLYYKASKYIIYKSSNNEIIKHSDKCLKNSDIEDLYKINSIYENKLYSYKIEINDEYKTILNGENRSEKILDDFETIYISRNKTKKNISTKLNETMKKYKNILYYPFNILIKYEQLKFNNNDNNINNIIKPIIKTIEINDNDNNTLEECDEYIIEDDDDKNDNILDNEKFNNILSLLPDEYYNQCYGEWKNLVSFCKSNKLDINIVDIHSKRGKDKYNKNDNNKNYRSIKGWDNYIDNIGWLYNQLKQWNNEEFENIKKNRKEKLRIRYLPYKILKIIENEPDLIDIIIKDPKKPDIKYSNNYIFRFNNDNCIWEIVEKNDIIFIIQDIINSYKKMYEILFNKNITKYTDDKEIKELKKQFSNNCKKFDTTNKMRNLNNFIDRFLKHPKIFDDDFYNLINKNKYELPIKNNKIINLKTKQIRQRTKTDYFSFYCNVEYINKNKKYDDKTIEIDDKMISPNDLFYKFIDNFTLGDDETKLYLQKILGYYISGETNANVFYVFCGGGANGKSTIFNLLFHLLNRTNKDNNVISLGEDVLIQGKNGNRATQIKALQNARIGICQETPVGSKLNINLIKQITGGDGIAIEEKFATEMTKLSINTKLIISTNNKPEFDGESHANIRRFRYFNCDCRFVSRKTSNKNERKGIDNIEELLKKYCMDLFFTWIIDGAFNYFNSNDKKLEYDIPKNIKKVQDEYINIMSSVKSWFDNKIIKTDNNKDYIKRSDTYKIYELYCNDEIGISPLKKKEFFEKINNLLGEPIKSNGDMIFKNYKFNIVKNDNNDLDGLDD
jgi:P4 family phage/plasmid primase-like protien